MFTPSGTCLRAAPGSCLVLALHLLVSPFSPVILRVLFLTLTQKPKLHQPSSTNHLLLSPPTATCHCSAQRRESGRGEPSPCVWHRRLPWGSHQEDLRGHCAVSGLSGGTTACRPTAVRSRSACLLPCLPVFPNTGHRQSEAQWGERRRNAQGPVMGL